MNPSPAATQSPAGSQGPEGSPGPHWPLRVAIAGVVLALFHLPPRVYLAGLMGWGLLLRPVKNLPKALISGTYDSAYIAGLTVLFILAVLPFSFSSNRGARGALAARGMYITFLMVGALSLLLAIANIGIVQTMGRTFNVRWLYYADFLRGADARLAVTSNLTARGIAAAICLALAFVLLSVKLGALAARRAGSVPSPRHRLLAAAVVAALIAYLLLGRWYLVSRQWPHETLANPVWALASSLIDAGHAPALFTMKTGDVGDEDFAPPSAPENERANLLPSRELPATRGSAGASPSPGSAIGNVVLYVFESVPAEYVGCYDPKYASVTPNLTRWSQRGAVFDNIYAHAPATNKSLCSMLCSVYPWISFKTVSQEKPDVALPSIVSVLKEHGYATAMFYGGDIAFQGAGAFVKARGFDLVQDYRHRPASKTIFTNDRWPFLNGSDDQSTADSLRGWFEQQHRAGKPAFAMLWTQMTHYPYFTTGRDAPLGPTENLFNHYLNALRNSDAAFGSVLDQLEAQHMLDDTLVIALGDHGEAFGRHDQLSHGNKIYEENCHIPLLLIHSSLAGQRLKTIGGLVDLAPTVCDRLGLPAADMWQGRSLFDPARSNRTYFFAPWSDYLFGYRERETKFIYNATTDRFELYDLASDPTEQHNLIEAHRNEIAQRTARLAAWVQYQNRMFGRLMK